MGGQMYHPNQQVYQQPLEMAHIYNNQICNPIKIWISISIELHHSMFVGVDSEHLSGLAYEGVNTIDADVVGGVGLVLTDLP